MYKTFSRGFCCTALVLAATGCQPSDNDTLNATVDNACESCDGCCAEEGAGAPVAATGQVTSYTEGDDGQWQRGQSVDDRFESCGDGTLLDRQTGLMWLANGSCLISQGGDFETDGTKDGRIEWSDALRFVDELNAGSFDACVSTHEDWRLPNVRELATLIDAEEPELNLALMADGFRLVEANAYWTSTSYAALADTLAFTVNLGDGSVSHGGTKGTVTYSVLAVRDDCEDAGAAVAATGQAESVAAGDDGDTQSGIATADDRFTDHGDGTLTDNLTGLMWVRDAACAGTYNWESAAARVIDINRNPKLLSCDGLAAYTDWRFPNRHELASLVNFGQAYPALPENHPFENVGDGDLCWTSTTYAPETGKAWTVDFRTGDVLPDYKANRHVLMLVRK